MRLACGQQQVVLRLRRDISGACTGEEAGGWYGRRACMIGREPEAPSGDSYPLIILHFP